MSRESVEIVRKAFEAHKAGGVEALLPFYAADVACYPTQFLKGSVYRGHDGAIRLESAFADYFDDFAFDVDEIRDMGERVLARATMTGRIKDSGAPIRQSIGVLVSDFRDGLIGEIRFFNWQEALEAVGLAE